MTGIGVVGGSGGTTACYEDLLGVAGLLTRVAGDVSDARDFLGCSAARWLIESLGSCDPVGALRLGAAMAELASPFGALGRCDALLDQAIGLLHFAVAAYRHTDDGVFGAITSALGDATHALTAVGAAGGALLAGRGAGAAGQQLLTSDPGIADDLAGRLLFDTILGDVAAHYPDGHAVVHDLGIDGDDVTRTPPRDVFDLMSQLAVQDSGSGGQISVAFVHGADGQRRAIVDVPGTKSWDPGEDADVTSLSTNARAIVGSSTAYEQGVLAAMSRAGVRRDEPVMLVGHSEGGMVAVNAARDAVASGSFDVTHVITAGSPIGRTVGALPRSVQVLALENGGDVVPHLDDAANPDRRNITTVTVHHDDGNIGDEHSLGGSYELGAEDVDESRNISVRHFLSTSGGFFRGRRIRTHDYLITRAY